MAMAELARCFGEERALEVLRALQSEVWMVWVRSEDEMEPVYESIHRTEIDASRALLQYLIDQALNDEVDLEDALGWNTDLLMAHANGEGSPLQHQAWFRGWNEYNNGRGVSGQELFGPRRVQLAD